MLSDTPSKTSHIHHIIRLLLFVDAYSGDSYCL